MDSGKEVSERKRIASIFLMNKISATFIIPIDLARKYKLDQHSHVVLEEQKDGILIKKIEEYK